MCYNLGRLNMEVLHMAYTCGDCKYYGEKGCPRPQNDTDHVPCSDFKR